MQAWVFFVILGVFAVGMAWGFMVGRSKNTSLRRAEQLDIELHELRGQTSEYKQQVSQHFAKTADVVNAMTTNYRALYDQLIKGAQDLCGDQLDSAKLDPSQVRFIEHRRNNVNENKEAAAPDTAIKGPSSGAAPAAEVHGAGNGEAPAAASSRPSAATAPIQGGAVIEPAVQKANGEADVEAAGEEKRAPEIVIAKASEQAPSPAVDDGEDKTQVQAKSSQAGTDAKAGASESLTVH